MTLFIKRILMLSLFYAAAAEILLRGAEPQAPVVPDNGTPDERMAKIVEVNTANRTLTLQVKGAAHLFYLSPLVTNTRTHQQITLDQLATGEFISFVARPLFNGQLEIVSLIILPNGSGAPSGGGSYGGPFEVSPFK